MFAETVNSKRLPWLCRLIGHRWIASHWLVEHGGKPVWVYLDHVCRRCWVTEKRDRP